MADHPLRQLPEPSARAIYFILTVLYVLFFVVHIPQVVKSGWGNFWSMVMGYERIPSGEAASDTDAPAP